MMHGSAFDRFDENDDEEDFVDAGYTDIRRNGTGGMGGGAGGGGGGYRVVREERRVGRTKGSPSRHVSSGRRNVSPRRKVQSSARLPQTGEWTTERVPRVRSSHREPSPRRRQEHYVQQEYHHGNGEPEVRSRSSRTTRTTTTSQMSPSYAEHNGPIMDYDMDDLGDDFQSIKVSRSKKERRDGVQRTESGRSSRSRNGVFPPQVEEHAVEFVDDDFDADLQYVKNPSPKMNRLMGDPRRMKGGKKFLRDVQDELEEQRTQWESEVDKLSQGTLLRGVPKHAQTEGTNSFVDMSTGQPIFKAFFDVSEFPKKGMAVSVDKIQNKIIVKGAASQGAGTLTRTFTQKVQLPKFADDQRMVTKLSKNGILKVELPLIYYFPEEKTAERKPRSFVNEIRTRRDGTQVLEILANAGTDVKARDLKVHVTEENELVITAEKERRNGQVSSNLVKRYTLPTFADLDRISSRLGKDGRLVVRVPLKRKAIHDP